MSHPVVVVVVTLLRGVVAAQFLMVVVVVVVAASLVLRWISLCSNGPMFPWSRAIYGLHI
jgi:hypothetical protein